MFFWILWGWDVLIACVFLYFSFIGLADGSVSSFNIRLWLGTLSVLGVIIGGGLWSVQKIFQDSQRPLINARNSRSFILPVLSDYFYDKSAMELVLIGRKNCSKFLKREK